MVIIVVKYYQYNGFLLINQFEVNWNNNIGPALLISPRDEASNVTSWRIGNCGYLSCRSMAYHTLTHIYNIDVLPARITFPHPSSPISYSTVKACSLPPLKLVCHIQE